MKNIFKNYLEAMKEHVLKEKDNGPLFLRTNWMLIMLKEFFRIRIVHVSVFLFISFFMSSLIIATFFNNVPLINFSQNVLNGSSIFFGTVGVAFLFWE